MGLACAGNFVQVETMLQFSGLGPDDKQPKGMELAQQRVRISGRALGLLESAEVTITFDLNKLPELFKPSQHAFRSWRDRLRQLLRADPEDHIQYVEKRCLARTRYEAPCRSCPCER
jgi:hypothetical protein